MKLFFQRAAALAVGLALWSTTALHAANERQYQMASDSAEAADAMASYSSIEQCNYSDYTPGHMGWGQSRMVRQGHFVVGGEYLYVRPTFSEADGLVTITTINPGPITQIDYIPIDFDYNSSYRAYGGYRWEECGEELIFTYTRFDNDSDFDSGIAPNANVVFRDPHQEVPVGPNDRVLQDVNVEAAVFDLAFGKTIPICSCYQKCCGGCDSCCGDTCCDTCCDPCCGDGACGDGGCGNGCDGCCPCPAWDFTWRAGVRFADIDWDRTGTIDRAVGPDVVGFTTLEFEGGGPRVGLTGRRYCGQSRIFSVYASSDAAILLGDVDIVHSQNNGAVVTTFSNTQLFPVLDIEAGGEVQVTQNLKLSAGYLFSAWFDLGMRDTIVVLAANQGAFFDDANILGFDGAFARAELSF